jgi:hypothetical protein
MILNRKVVPKGPEVNISAKDASFPVISPATGLSRQTLQEYLWRIIPEMPVLKRPLSSLSLKISD